MQVDSAKADFPFKDITNIYLCCIKNQCMKKYGVRIMQQINGRGRKKDGTKVKIFRTWDSWS